MDTILTTIINNKEVSIAVGLTIFTGLAFALKGSKKSEKTFEKDVVYLFDIAKTNLEVPHASPFVMKVACFLRYANIPYKVLLSMDGGPRNKYPYVKYNGETFYDSHYIIKQLAKKLNIKGLFKETDEARAQEILLLRFIEESIYWKLVYYRWVAPQYSVVDDILMSVPSFIRPLIKYRVGGSLAKSCYAVGISRYSEEERVEMINDDMFTLATLLGDKQYFIGNSLSYIDLAIFSMLTQTFYTQVPTPARQAILSHPNLVDYLDRLKTKFYPTEVEFNQSITFQSNLKKSK